VPCLLPHEQVPPLRVRPSDVKDLVRYILSNMNKLPANNKDSMVLAKVTPSTGELLGTTTTSGICSKKMLL
jgi:transcriptional regulator with GAF, ATPase, and Fis domain